MIRLSSLKLLSSVVILGILVNACAGNKPDPNEINKLLKTGSLDTKGMSVEKVALRITQSEQDRSEDLYTLEMVKFVDENLSLNNKDNQPATPEANPTQKNLNKINKTNSSRSLTKRTDRSEEKIPGDVLCKFNKDLITTAKEVVIATQSIGLTIVTKDFAVSEAVKRFNEENDIVLRDLYFNTRPKNELIDAKIQELINDPDTVLIVRNVDINHKESTTSLTCEFTMVEKASASEDAPVTFNNLKIKKFGE